jgi:hypothetical protein
MANQQMSLEEANVTQNPVEVAPSEVAPTEVAPVEVMQQEIAPVQSAYTSMANFTDIYRIGREMSKTQLVPQSYQNKPMDCAIAIDIANRMGLSPLTVMQNLWVVRGIPSWSGQACMSLIIASKRYKNVKPVYVGKEGQDDWGCYISAIEVSSGEEVNGTTVTIALAKKEGWYGKSGSKWQTMPQQMLAYRAAAFFARVYCPSELMGFKVEGEIEDISASKEASKATDVFAKKGDK